MLSKRRGGVTGRSVEITDRLPPHELDYPRLANAMGHTYQKQFKRMESTVDTPVT